MKSSPACNGLTRPGPDRPSASVYDTFWRFAVERQDIYLARLKGEAPPWTTDPILAEYKFTNAYRAADRVSQYLIRKVIYQDQVPVTPEDTLFRILIFKIFNRIETWELLEAHVGPITYRDFAFDRYDEVLSAAMTAGEAIYSAAYIMPSVRHFAHQRKHRSHLALVELMMRDSLAQKLAACENMEAAFEMLLRYPSIGKFLAYQFVTDINYSELTEFSESEFVVAGPGAVDGLAKVFGSQSRLSEEDLIRWVWERQEDEFEKLGESFKSLFGRRLQYIDCQNLFCEVGKYARVAHPEVKGRSGRTRIKQKFSRTDELPRPWFPPKWDINQRIDADLNGTA